VGLVTKQNCISENNFFGNVILNPAKKVCIRVGKLFIGSHISFVHALRFMYCRAEKLISAKWCQKQ